MATRYFLEYRRGYESRITVERWDEDEARHLWATAVGELPRVPGSYALLKRGGTAIEWWAGDIPTLRELHISVRRRPDLNEHERKLLGDLTDELRRDVELALCNYGPEERDQQGEPLTHALLFDMMDRITGAMELTASQWGLPKVEERRRYADDLARRALHQLLTRRSAPLVAAAAAAVTALRDNPPGSIGRRLAEELDRALRIARGEEEPPEQEGQP